MLYNYKSDSLSELAELFSDKLLSYKKGDPFHKPWIVVQNKEVKQWLSLQIAKKVGIVANLEFVLPSELMWRLYRQYKPDTPKILPFDRLPLQWRIYDFLMNTDNKELGNVNNLPFFTEERQIFQFSGQVADVFDLYQMYRPEMLKGWELGKLSTKDRNEYWQLWLWQSLKLSIGNEIPDRGKAFTELISILDNINLDITSMPPGILVFGLSHFSNPFAQLINSLSKSTEVQFFTHEFNEVNNDVFRNKWNLLVEHWGSLKQESSEILDSYDIEQISLINSENTSVFKKLRSGEQSRELIEIHSCHSSKREIEVLKDRLLDYFNSNSNLKPEEVLILVPDMKEYSPLIKSIFGFNEGEPSIPIYAPNSFIDPFQLAFIELITFISGDFKANDFIDLIELETFSNRFNFSDEEYSLIRQWMVDNHIHFGLEKTDSSFSLDKLIESLTIGYSTETSLFELYEGIGPTKGIKTTDQLSLISRLSSCIEFIKSAKEKSLERYYVQQWIKIFKDWINEINFGEKSSFINHLDRLGDNIKASGTSISVEFDMIKKWLLIQFDDVQATSSGLGHGIVLSSYIPYRNIPFKVVAVLGLNESSFPRNPFRPTFDLIENDPRPGERITKKDDELLFLELLNSAQDKFYLSYIGQDQHSENELLPSILIQKLVDVIEENDDKIVTVKERLHGFNQSYFISQKSYSSRLKKLSEKIATETESEQIFITEKLSQIDSIDQKVIQLKDLIKFYDHPCKYISQNVLGISEGHGDSEIEDREIFNLNGLDRYKLDETIFEGLSQNISGEVIQNYARSKGFIPEGLAGEKDFNSEMLVVNELSSKINSLINSTPISKEISIKIGGYELQGSLDEVYDSGLILWRTGKERAKDLIHAWIKHLVLQELNSANHTFLVCKDGSNNKITVSVLKEVDRSKEFLKSLVNWYLKAHYDLYSLCFFPECSKAYYEASLDVKKSAKNLAIKKWESTEYSSGEGDDFYNKLIWRGIHPLEEKLFEELSVLFWKPLIESKG